MIRLWRAQGRGRTLTLRYFEGVTTVTLYEGIVPVISASATTVSAALIEAGAQAELAVLPRPTRTLDLEVELSQGYAAACARWGTHAIDGEIEAVTPARGTVRPSRKALAG